MEKIKNKNFLKLKDKIKKCVTGLGLFDKPVEIIEDQQPEDNDLYNDYLAAMNLRGIQICKRCNAEHPAGEICRRCDQYNQAILSQGEFVEPVQLTYNELQNTSLQSNLLPTKQVSEVDTSRLQKLNLWYASDNTDRDLVDAIQKIKDIIGRFNVVVSEEVEKRAIQMFYDIREYYKTHNTVRLGIKSNVKDLRLAYIILCIYYSVLSLVGESISTTDMCEYLGSGVRIKIPEATKNIMLIFEKNEKYPWLNEKVNYYLTSWGGLRNYLSPRFKRIMDQLLKQLDKKIPGYGLQPKQTIAMIYFIGKKVLTDYTIELPDQPSSKINLKLLERNTNVSTVTISTEEKAIQTIITDINSLKQIF